jgi:hypothetical protein
VTLTVSISDCESPGEKKDLVMADIRPDHQAKDETEKAN